MSTITPAELKADVQKALTDINALVVIADDLPGLPTQVKVTLDGIKAALTAVNAFLNA